MHRPGLSIPLRGHRDRHAQITSTLDTIASHRISGCENIFFSLKKWKANKGKIIVTLDIHRPAKYNSLESLMF